jgi:hypothetical protein
VVIARREDLDTRLPAWKAANEERPILARVGDKARLGAIAEHDGNLGSRERTAFVIEDASAEGPRASDAPGKREGKEGQGAAFEPHALSACTSRTMLHHAIIQ